MTVPTGGAAENDDSIGRFDDWKGVGPSVAFRYNPGMILPTDEFSRKSVKPNMTHAFTLALHLAPAPYLQSDDSLEHHSPDMPHLSFGIRYGLNHDVRMHRDRTDGGSEADYDSQMGNNISLYGTYERPWMTSGRWQILTYVGTGVGYSRRKYNPRTQVDNELIGSHLSFFLTCGIATTYRLSDCWRLYGGLDYSHHSNGALSCPNKGANHVGPFLGVVYETTPTAPSPSLPSGRDGEGVTRHLLLDFTLGVGGKALDEEWQRTQFHVAPDDPDYRTSHFRIYAAYSLQAALMRRYGKTRATGVGVDVLYGTYYRHVEKLDRTEGHNVSHSPWSIALALQHHVRYRRFTARFGLGYYLYRHMGVRAKDSEKPYYERIGLHYTFPRLHGLSVGFQVKTHIFRSDLSELQVAIPVNIGK